MEKITIYDTATEAISDLFKRGYKSDFLLNPEKNFLQCKETKFELSLSQFIIDEVHRFEGNTDPADEMIVYAISSVDGAKKGVDVNGYGIYSSDQSQKLVELLQTKK